MHVTHDVLAGQPVSARRLTVCRLLRLDRVLLRDLQPLVGLHAAIADELRTLHTPRGGVRVVAATATLDLILGRLHAARIVLAARRGRFAQKHVVDDVLEPALHLAHRTDERRVVRQLRDLLLHARVARIVQTFQQLRMVVRCERLLAPDTFRRCRRFICRFRLINLWNERVEE